jgi:hypothetical protein
MAQVSGTQSAWDSFTNKALNTQRATGMPEVADNSASLPITTTNISVYANNQRVGFVQSFNPSEQRSITKVQELGTEGVVQSVPGNTNGGTITLSRFAIYNAMLFNALGMTPTGQFTRYDQQLYESANKYQPDSNTLGNPFKTLKDQRVPLELQTKTIMPDDQNTSYYVETYIDCWVQTYSRSIQTSQITITESATLSYSDIYSSMATTD